MTVIYLVRMPAINLLPPLLPTTTHIKKGVSGVTPQNSMECEPLAPFYVRHQKERQRLLNDATNKFVLNPMLVICTTLHQSDEMEHHAIKLICHSSEKLGCHCQSDV
jgi:hypothetical protein